jgi:ABC-2 type transport system ATP-binding protein
LVQRDGESGIELIGISHAYSGRKVLDDVNLVVPRGQSMALLGPNGAGKSTLMNILSALVKPTEGRAFLAGVDVAKSSQSARQKMGIVFQDDSLDDRLTAWENLEFHGLVYGMDKSSRERRAAEVLALVELEQWRDSTVRSFSGGMKRRLEIARALMHEPEILFLDEPTVGLDAQTRAKIWAYLNEQRKTGRVTVFVTTHYLEEAESCDQICVLDFGKILAQGTPAELKAKYAATLIRCLPRDEGTRAAILAQWPQAQQLAGGRLGVVVESPIMLDDFLARFGSVLKEILIDEPSLETVFLAMTGREIRDRSEDGALTGKAGRRTRRV